MIIPACRANQTKANMEATLSFTYLALEQFPCLRHAEKKMFAKVFALKLQLFPDAMAHHTV